MFAKFRATLLATFSKVFGICPNSSLAIIPETQESVEGPFFEATQNLVNNENETIFVDMSSNTEETSKGFIIF